MRVLTATVASLAALGAATVAGVEISQPCPRRGEGLGAGRRDDGDAGAGGGGRQEDAADLSRLSRPNGIDPQHRLAGARVRLRRIPAGAGRGRREERRPPLPDRSSRPAGGARPGASAGAARRRVARIRQGQFRPRRGAGEERLRRQGRLRPARRARCIRPRRRWRVDQAAVEAAQLNLGYAEIRAPFAGRLGRNQAAKGRARRTGVRAAQHARPARSDLRLVQPQRVRTGAKSPRRAPPARSRPRFRSPATSGAVRKGELTFLDNAVDKSTGTISARVTIANPDFALLPGRIRPRAAAHQGRAGRADGAADGARVEPDGQIRLCRRRRRQGRAAPADARADATASSSASSAA